MFARVRKWWVHRKIDELSKREVRNPGIEIEAYYDGKKLMAVVVKFLHDSNLEAFVVIASVGDLREQYKVKVQKLDDWPEYNEVMIAPISKGHGEFIPGTEVVTKAHLNKIIAELNHCGQVLFTEMCI